MKYEDTHDLVLLSTKLKMPAPRRNYIARHELFAQLQSSREMKVIYIMGAAGMGKTTLISSFITEQAPQHTAWLSLDEGNNHVFSFWHYFIAAVGEFLGEELEDILSLLRSSIDKAHVESLLTLVINRLCCDQDYYVVLDDMHCIHNKALLDSLEFFLKSMPDNLHLIMLSRENPVFYLGEFAVSGQLLFIDGSKLRLSHEEGLRFLKETLQLSASDEELHQMNDAAEGWVGGLQLVAAAGGACKGLLHAAGSGITADYLTREVFRLLTEEERNFLTTTCILAYFDEELCRHLQVGADFHNMVQILSDKNLFITCINEEKGIYRYHNILGEYLMQQFMTLPKPVQVELHQAASEILERRGDKGEALRHLFIAEEFERAKQILCRMEETVETWFWIDKLPLHVLISNINLAVQCLMYNISSLQLARSREICSALEEKYKGDEILKGLQNISLYIGDGRNDPTLAILLTLQQIEDLELSPVTQSLLLIENANISLTQHNYTQCEEFADRALEIGGRANICMDYYALSSKAQLMEEMGRFNESLATYARMESLLHSSTMMDALGYNYYIGSIGVYHKRMDEARAKEALEATSRIISSRVVPSFMVELGYEYHQAEYELLFGNAQKGARVVDKMLEGYFSKDILQLDRLLSLLYTMGLLKTEVAEWFIQEFRLQGAEKGTLGAQLLFARMLADKGEMETAMQHIDHVLAFSRAHKNRLRLVEASLLKIRLLVTSGCGKTRTIENYLQEALHYARDNEILQPFFLERTVLSSLLPIINSSTAVDLNEGEQQFLKDVTRICTIPHQTNTKEIVSARELEVLAELAAGLTNSEIANRLCISLATVKTHIVNIFGKLEVSNRLAAVQEAKRKGLI
ncbi:hypothetical protein DCC85_03970 [Paenibacillus sp. CAA11]|uniref:LuxR C-terminal-related transcriptional regulator n=1 Tax=Paenibacillus sp. CAA11 TaxID=1532905 RepID=UPI000D3A3F72|nr:LuxR C-terminal-related transcriptional regulator [Paenibacillus sp. CAA11]AWB43463.1 hypothetical protein DCC85_03970 [Paenibacillus sp. CAA11]